MLGGVAAQAAALPPVALTSEREPFAERDEVTGDPLAQPRQSGPGGLCVVAGDVRSAEKLDQAERM